MIKEYVLNVEPAEYKIDASNTRGTLEAGYTGREIDVEKGYALARQWIEIYETSCDNPFEFETQFLRSLASATKATLEGPLFRGRFFEEHQTPGFFDFGPPPAEKTQRNRYNKPGQPALYLCSSLSGVSRELDHLQRQGKSLWTQRFRLPLKLKILDARSLPGDSFASAVFWVIESSRDRSTGEPPKLGARVAELIALRGYDVMVVPGVRGEPGDLYSNVIIFRPGDDRWKSFIEQDSTPIRSI
jgi:hypothetical protein